MWSFSWTPFDAFRPDEDYIRMDARCEALGLSMLRYRDGSFDVSGPRLKVIQYVRWLGDEFGASVPEELMQ